MSTSVGVPGLRVTRGPRGTYVTAGYGGIYYRKRVDSAGKPVPHAVSQVVQRNGSQVEVFDPNVFETVTDIGQQEFVEILNEWTTRGAIQLTTFGAILFVAGAMAYVGVQNQSAWIALLLAAPIAQLVASNIENRRRQFAIDYELSPKDQTRFEALCDGIATLSRSGSLDVVRSESQHGNWKYSGGATSALDLARASLVRVSPPHITSNIHPFALNVQGRMLYFYPDRVLIRSDKRFDAMSYEVLKTESETRVFVWDRGQVPHDGEVVGHSWKYTRRDGGPDRRFNDNRQIPNVRVLYIRIFVDNIPAIVLQTTGIVAGKHFANALLQYAIDSLKMQSTAALSSLPPVGHVAPSLSPPPSGAPQVQIPSAASPESDWKRLLIIGASIGLGFAIFGGLLVQRLADTRSGEDSPNVSTPSMVVPPLPPRPADTQAFRLHAWIPLAETATRWRSIRPELRTPELKILSGAQGAALCFFGSADDPRLAQLRSELASPIAPFFEGEADVLVPRVMRPRNIINMRQRPDGAILRSLPWGALVVSLAGRIDGMSVPPGGTRGWSFIVANRAETGWVSSELLEDFNHCVPSEDEIASLIAPGDASSELARKAVISRVPFFADGTQSTGFLVASFDPFQSLGAVMLFRDRGECSLEPRADYRTAMEPKTVTPVRTSESRSATMLVVEWMARGAQRTVVPWTVFSPSGQRFDVEVPSGDDIPRARRAIVRAPATRGPFRAEGYWPFGVRFADGEGFVLSALDDGCLRRTDIVSGATEDICGEAIPKPSL